MSNDQKRYYFNEKIEKGLLKSLKKERSTKINIYCSTTKHEMPTNLITIGTH